MAVDNRRLKPMENEDVPKKRRISTLGQRMDKGFEVTQVKSSAELLAQYKIKRETFQQEHKDIFQANGVNNQEIKQPIRIEEDSCKDQRPKLKERKIQPMSLFQENEHNGNPIGIAAEKISEVGNHSKVAAQTSQAGNHSKVAAEKNMKTAEKNSTPRNQTTVEIESNSNPNSNTSELSVNPTKSGMTLDMYFKVHGIDLDNEEDEDEVYNNHVEDAENEEGNGANPNGNGKSSNNQGKAKNESLRSKMEGNWSIMPESPRLGVETHA